MSTQKIMYVVFMHDPQSKNYEAGSAMDSEMYACFGPKTLFEDNSCFRSPAEAEQYISTLLVKREMISGQLRPDIQREHFSIRPVYQTQLWPNAYCLEKTCSKERNAPNQKG